MNEAYLREKFSNAVDGLATGTGELRERVRNAMIILIMFDPDDMPDGFSREQFSELVYRSTDREADADEGQLTATLERMDTDDVCELAGTVLRIHNHLLRRTNAGYAAEQKPSASN